jgi:outer membrane receptor protein involved in Fe transport
MAQRRLLPLLVLTGLLALPSVARADRRAEARRHYRLAMQRIDQGRPMEAVALLEEAYDALPHPDVLYNIAQIYVDQGMPQEALPYFRRYLESGPEDAEQVRVTITRLQALLPAPGPAPVAEAPARTATVAVTPVDLGRLTESRDLMRALAQATDSERLRAAADGLTELERALKQGASPAPAPSPAPAEPPALSPPPTRTTTAAPPLPPSSAPRSVGVYDAQIVSASRYIQSPLDAPSATHIITQEEIRASGLTNIGELLRRVPGADVMTTSPADVNVSIRGFNQRLANRLLVLVDGRSVYLDPLGTVFWNMLTISVEDVERIEVIRGPASAIYGADAFAGVVNIITRLPGEERTELTAGGGSHRWFHEQVATSGHTEQLGYRLSAGFDNAQRFSQELADDRVDFERNFSEQDLSLRMLRANGSLSYRFAPDVALIVRGGLAHGRSEWQAASGLRDFGMNVNANAFASAQLDTRWGLARVFYHRIDGNGGPQYVPLGNDPYQFTMVSSTLDVELMFSQAFSFIVPHNLQVGGNYRRKAVDWNYLDRPHTQDHFAVFLQDNLRITSWLSVQGSIRADFHPLLDSPPISPRAAVIVRPSQDSAVRLSAGTAFRTPSFLESYINVGANFDVPALTGTTRGSEVIGRTLNPESIVSMELSYANSASSFFDVEVVGYYSRVSNLAPVPAPTPRTSPSSTSSGRSTGCRSSIPSWGSTRWARRCIATRTRCTTCSAASCRCERTRWTGWTYTRTMPWRRSASAGTRPAPTSSRTAPACTS